MSSDKPRASDVFKELVIQQTHHKIQAQWFLRQTNHAIGLDGDNVDENTSNRTLLMIISN